MLISLQGANDWGTGKYMADITSYDYDAVMDEAGDPHPYKYELVKNVIEKHFNLPNRDVPPIEPKMSLPAFTLNGKGKLLSEKGRMRLATDTNQRRSEKPLSFEQIDQFSGLVLYETILSPAKINPTRLTINGLHDRAYVFLNESLVGILSRENGIDSMPINVTQTQSLQIFVENQGRINFNVTDDFKVRLCIS